MSTTVHLPDGSTVSVPTDDPKAASAAAKRFWATQQAQGPQASKLPKAPPSSRAKKAQRSGWQTAGDFLGDTIDNVLPNWGDEIAAIPDAAVALAKGQPVGEAFDRGQADFKANQAQYDEEHPNLAWASTIAGIGASLALPAGNLVRGAGMTEKAWRAAQALNAAKIGGLYGAVSGAGEGEGIAARGANAARSGAIAAAGGAALSRSMPTLLKGARAIRQNVPGVDGGLRQLARIPAAVLRRPMPSPQDRARAQADRMMMGKLSEGNIQTGMGQQGPSASPAAVVAEVERRSGLGVPAMPGDTTETLRNMTSWASRGMGAGQTMVRQRLDARKAAEAARARQHVIDEMGPVVDPLAQVAAMSARAKAAAAPGYRESYAQPMVLTPEIEAIMGTPAFRDALPQALTNIRNDLGDPNALGFRMAADGTMDPNLQSTLSTEGFDQVIRAMKDNGRAAMDTNGIRPVNTSNSVKINARASDLRSRLGEQNPAYDDVTKRYADDMAQRDAFLQGGDVQKVTGHELNDQLRHMPDNAQGAWAIGARTAFADQASTYGAKYPTGDTAMHISRALGDDVKQEAIGRAMGNTGAVRGLQGRLEAEQQSNILWKEVQGNSRTASRQAIDSEADSAAGKLALSDFTLLGAAGRVVNFIGDRSSLQFRNDVKARVAEVVTETNPQNLQELMAQIANRAEKDKDFADLLHRSGIIGTKAYANNIVPMREDGQVLLDVEEGPSGEAVPLYGRYEDNFDAEGRPL